MGLMWQEFIDIENIKRTHWASYRWYQSSVCQVNRKKPPSDLVFCCSWARRPGSGSALRVFLWSESHARNFPLQSMFVFGDYAQKPRNVCRSVKPSEHKGVRPVLWQLIGQCGIGSDLVNSLDIVNWEWRVEEKLWADSPNSLLILMMQHRTQNLTSCRVSELFV